MSDHKRRTWRPRYTWMVLLIGVVAVAAAGYAGVRLLRGDDQGVSVSGRCAGAKYVVTATRDDDGRGTARVRIVTSRPGQEWAVRVSATGQGDLLDRSVASDENAQIVVRTALGTSEQPTRVRVRVARPDKEPCTVQGSLG